MIALMKRILSVSGPYQGRIKLAFVFAFLKAMLSKAPIGLSFLALSAFLQGTMTARLCLWLAVGTVGCVLLECLCQNIADRLQAAAGYMVFADLRMELGRHLRRLPMGYFTEGNIGKISSVLSTDMVFIEENCMHDIANMMSYTFAQAILVLWLAFLNPWLGLAALVVVGIIWQLGRASLGSTLAHSDVRQEQSEALTRAVLAQPELPDRGRETLPKAGGAPEVEFRNVTFAYGEKEVLHDVSFTLEKNRMLALVGPSGGGKSTVANLLSRFWDVKQGQILVRGRDIRDIPLSDLMDQISMVFQRVYLFQDTVYNNIAMGRTDATREEVYEAARKARCYDFIMELPDGFDTVIGEGGASLSGGERQRISIARCILKDAPIVILDEATASVDADNESYIQEAITQLCRGKTLLVIAHRLNTIRHADEILVIDQGRIVQAGAHDTLMEEEGIYRRFITARSNPTSWCR